MLEDNIVPPKKPEEKYPLTKELLSFGVTFPKTQNKDIESVLLQKSLKRYKDIVLAYKRYNEVSSVPWEIINNIYIKDISFRRIVNIHIARLEILMRAHIMNVLRNKKIMINKSNNDFSNKYLIKDEIGIKSFIKAKRSFRWNKRVSVPLNGFMEEANFSITIEIYMKLKEEYINSLKKPIIKSEENYNKIINLKEELRNPIAHQSMLYTRLDKEVLQVYVIDLLELSKISKDKTKNILDELIEMYV